MHGPAAGAAGVLRATADSLSYRRHHQCAARSRGSDGTGSAGHRRLTGPYRAAGRHAGRHAGNGGAVAEVCDGRLSAEDRRSGERVGPGTGWVCFCRRGGKRGAGPGGVRTGRGAARGSPGSDAGVAAGCRQSGGARTAVAARRQAAFCRCAGRQRSRLDGDSLATLCGWRGGRGAAARAGRPAAADGKTL